MGGVEKRKGFKKWFFKLAGFVLLVTMLSAGFSQKQVTGAENESEDFEISDGVLLKYHGNEENVIIPKGVTCIGRSAFYDSGLTSITIPKSVTVIEEDAFKDLIYLKIQGEKGSYAEEYAQENKFKFVA